MRFSTHLICISQFLPTHLHFPTYTVQVAVLWNSADAIFCSDFLLQQWRDLAFWF